MLSLAITSRDSVIRFGGLLQGLLILRDNLKGPFFRLFDAILPAVVEKCADTDLTGGVKQVVEFAVAFGGIVSAILRTAQVKP